MLALGPTIVLWRTARGFSQQQLAERCRLARPNLSAIESGKRDITIGTLRALADALEVRPGVLVDGEAPGKESHKPLTRELMERIARDVSQGRTGGDESQLVADLAVLARSRIEIRRGIVTRRRRGVRAMNAAWLRLKARCTSAELESLIRRIDEQAAT